MPVLAPDVLHLQKNISYPLFEVEAVFLALRDAMSTAFFAGITVTQQKDYRTILDDLKIYESNIKSLITYQENMQKANTDQEKNNT